MPPANIEPPLIPLAHIRYTNVGRVRVTIDKPADAGDMQPQIVIRHEICGLEEMPLLMLGIITVACALFAGIVGLGTAIGFALHGWRPARRPPDAEI